MKIATGQEVECYFNLHKKCFSIRDKKTRKVIAHLDRLKMQGKFKVSEKGRQRVLKEQRKNVHAIVTGVFITEDVSDCNPFGQGYYEPYTTDFFVDHCSKERLDGEYVIWLIGKDIFYEEIKKTPKD